jgi:NAD(P)-dependent dehydrogenase (short-subunit alcohol dehydrogenase family)
MGKSGMPISGKAVLVTGCSSGIGEATARRLARTDFTVYATARKPETLSGLESAGCRILPLDVTDERSMETAVAAIEREAGALGVLVNNAGYSQSGAVEEVTLDAVRRQFETNVFGLLRLTQLVLPGMRRERRGRIVNVSSMGGKLTFPGGGVYHATKHAVEALSDALRFEIGGFGIEVVVIEPGLIRTDFSKAAIASMKEASDESPYRRFNEAVARATREAYVRGALAPFAGEPDDVARVIALAVQSKRPKPRYRVTGSAHLLLGLRAILPDRAWDAFLRMTYPEPGRH